MCAFVILLSHLQVSVECKVEGNSWLSIKVWFCIDMICMLSNEGKSRCVLYYLVLILIM